MKNKSLLFALGLAGLSTLAIAQEQSDEKVEEILVIGSRIPRVKAEGPAPVTTVTAQDILAQ